MTISQKIITAVVSIGILAAIPASAVSAAPSPRSVTTSTVTVVAATPYCNYLLTFRAWYCGLMKNDTELKDVVNNDYPDQHPPGSGPDAFNSATQITFSVFVFTIVLNILTDLFQLAGYAAVGFLIYAGYLYVLARGSADTIAKAKKTISSAIIGLIIVILANAIITTIIDNVLTV